MATLIQTMNELEDIVRYNTAQMLNLDPMDVANGGKVRIAWPQDGAPAWKIDEDITSIQIGESHDPFNVIRDTTYVDQASNPTFATETTAYTRIVQVKWVFRGPNAYYNATLVRSRIFAGRYNDYFNNNNLYLIPQVDSPVRSPEQFEGKWWERVDLKALYNNAVMTDESVAYLKSASITIKANEPGSTVNSQDASVDSTTVIHND
jgi:hypothetical protein